LASFLQRRQELLLILGNLGMQKFDGAPQLFVVERIECARFADLFPIQKHPLLFAKEFERPVGDTALIAVFAGWDALGIEHGLRLHGALYVLGEFVDAPLLGQHCPFNGLRLQFFQARLDFNIL
jgi:hypothetical protein